MATYTDNALEPFQVSGSVRIRCEYDPCYEPIAEECAAFERGDLVAVGFIREEKCPTCERWHHVDFLWGCVFSVQDRSKGLLRLAAEVGFDTSP